MMKDLYKLLFCLLFFNANSQNDLQNANWIFGNLAWLDFNNNNVISSPMPAYGNSVTSIIPNPVYQAFEGCASVSDEDGNLLFFTDGQRVYRIINNEITIIDFNNQTSDLLLGHGSSAQNVIIIPRPNSSSHYFIITISGYTSSNKGLYWSELDINTNQFISKNNVFSDGNVHFDNSFLNLSEALTSCVASNGIDTWIIVHQINNNYSRILSYLVTENGISTDPSGFFDVPFYGLNVSNSIKASPDKQIIALGRRFENPIIGQFNNETGEIVMDMNPIGITNDSQSLSTYSLDFSPSSEILYFSKWVISFPPNVQTGIFAVEMNDLTSETLVLSFGNNNNRLGSVQRAINDNLYVADNNQGHVVELKNTDDLDNLEINYIELLSPQNSRYGLPQWIWKTCQRTLSLNSPQNDVDGFVSYRERSEWIDASNRIFSTPDTQAIYHAGDYVELNPGFEAEFGTQFSAYIEGCSDNFEYRPAKSKQVKENALTAQLDQTLKGIVIYPNPSSSIIGIRSDNTFSKVTIISSEGRIVYDKATDKTNSYQVDISGFANGVYIVNVVDEKGKLVTQKLIKN